MIDCSLQLAEAEEDKARRGSLKSRLKRGVEEVEYDTEDEDDILGAGKRMRNLSVS